MRQTRSQTQKSQENDNITSNSTSRSPILNGNGPKRQLPTASIQVRKVYCERIDQLTDKTELVNDLNFCFVNQIAC